MHRSGAIPADRLGFQIERPDPGIRQWLKREKRTYIWTGEFRGEPAVYKLYRKREPWHTLRCALTRYRVEREYRAAIRLSSRGVPCAEALGWTAGHCAEHGFYELLVMRHVDRAVDLQTLMNDGYQTDFSPLYALARSMHDAGVCSQVLCSRNVLVVDARRTPHFVLIDFPRAYLFPRSVVGTRVARYDLILLTKDLEMRGATGLRSQITSYGMTVQQADELLAAAARHHGGKIARRRADAACRIHQILTRLTSGKNDRVKPFD